jgi:hypothetical protein
MRRVRLLVSSDPDTEYLPWRGKLLTVTMSDVVLCRLIGFGYQTGQERIDAFRTGVSAELETESNRLHGLGIDIPPLFFTLVLSDGSTLEVICGEVNVDVGDG